MSDITKCLGEGCVLRNTCYRYTAISNPHWQSFFTSSPLQENGCEHYWRTDEQVHRGKVSRQGDVSKVQGRRESSAASMVSLSAV
jgi:hypothetical protein